MPVLLTAGEILAAHARLRPQAVGARDLERSLTYREWNERACRLGNALRGLGLASGDRVAVLAYNRLEWVEIYAAVAKAGLVAVPVNFRLTPPEVAFIIENSGAAAVIVEDALIGTIDAVRDQLDLPADRYVHIGRVGRVGHVGSTTPAGWRAYEDLLADGAATEPDVVVGPDDTWCLMYTSGTTGSPKGVIRSHRGLAMLAFATGIEFRLHRRDVALLVMPSGSPTRPAS